MRPRDPGRFESAEYDVLVVGGGIYGLAVAYEAASRGLRTALIEASDFGSGASFNHQKTAHGGLRTLQTGRLHRAHDSIMERRALARIAPWFLRPLPFLIGTYRSVFKSRLALRAAFKLDAWLGRKRNQGIEPELHLPAPKLISKAATSRLFLGINPAQLTGGAQWYDYQMVESDRITVAFAEAADRAGADLANYVEAVAALKSDTRVVGMRVRDRETGREFEIRARLTVNAAGAGAGKVMAMFGVNRPFKLLKAMNVVTSRPASDIALAAPTASGRMLTLVPWRGHAIVGTGHSDAFVEPDALEVTESELERFIADANHAFPALRLTRADIRLVHRGIVPAVEGKNGKPDLRPEPEIRDHTPDGAAGAMTVIGVKYTTARGVAERSVDLAGKLLGKRLIRSRTATTVLPGAGIADHEALAIETARAAGVEFPTAVTRHIAALYAEASADVVRLMIERPELTAPVSPGSETLGAEVVHVMRNEMAIHLSDVLRRTGLAAAGNPDRETLRRCAEIAGLPINDAE
jgi:glycerol-3-phosphate dehydrogenase